MCGCMCECVPSTPNSKYMAIPCSRFSHIFDDEEIVVVQRMILKVTDVLVWYTRMI